VIYIDDLLLTRASKADINRIKAALNKWFKILDLGVYYFYLGIEVIRDYPRRTLWLSQKAYIKKVL
jgi:hypothetical protein